MLDRISVGGVLRIVTAALVLSLAVVPSAFAKGGPDKDHDDERRAIPDCRRDHDDDDHDHGGDGKLFCPKKQVLVRTDEKLCSEKPGLPPVIRKRVCCRHDDMTNCRPFRPCPPRSRS